MTLVCHYLLQSWPPGRAFATTTTRTPGGLGHRQRAIHRELWGPGITTRGQAADHAHALVLDELGPHHRRVLCLGCGVGTAALYLDQRRPVQVVGVSMSLAQIRLAERFAARSGPLRGTVQFAVADFTALPGRLSGFDLAFALESFVHAAPATGFFHMRPAHCARAARWCSSTTS